LNRLPFIAIVYYCYTGDQKDCPGLFLASNIFLMHSETFNKLVILPYQGTEKIGGHVAGKGRLGGNDQYSSQHAAFKN
jgi:hypothetical protein